MAEIELQDATVLTPYVGGAENVESWRDEIAHYYLSMQQFRECGIDEIFMSLAGMSARASEIRSRLVQMQTRSASSFRTQEIDYFISECDRQFKTWSRVQAT